VQVRRSETRPGGAANVAINLVSLGVKATVSGLIGADDGGKELTSLLENSGVQTALSCSERNPTISKLRVLSRNQQLIRLDTEDFFDAADSAAVSAVAAKEVASNRVCILSDYAKGSLAEVGDIIKSCRDNNVPVLVDPKGTDFSRYRGATALTPNLAEFEAVVGKASDDEDLVARARALCKELELEALVVTLSERGMLVVSQNSDVLLPTRAQQVFDVTGAGDTVIAVLAAGLAAGQGIEQAAAMANLAAGLVVAKIGVAAVTRIELNLALHGSGEGGRGVLTRDEALQVALEIKQRGERLVMTNGCFDILHKGHVAYLQEAKTRGDRLIVAINTDESVKRLKGESRPINPLQDRMEVLAGLAAVDWVVPFGEDTPADLIAAVLPDVLVKGGDYKPEDIAGGDAVIANGGHVEVLQFHEGRSTSSIVDAIRGDGQ
jgi:D-beta-D-heptose 7-phosphate kinase/D-beta-D-heptose 1-phosphate adenosyltransferase